MSGKSILPAALISALAAGAALPVTACDIRLAPLTVTPVAYDPFAFKAAVSHAEIDLDLSDSAGCEVVLRLTDASGVPMDRIELGDSPGVLFDVQPVEQGEARVDAAQRSVTVLLSAESPHASVRWNLIMTRDAVLPAGDYHQPLAVMAHADGQGADITSRSELWLRSVSRAQVNIAGASAGFGGATLSVIDFGTLVTGDRRRAFVQVRANTAVTLDISSANRGVLVNETMPQADPIAYQVMVDGQPIVMSGPNHIPLQPPPTIDGISLPMDVTIGDVRGKMAGRYSDVLTIEVSPR